MSEDIKNINNNDVMEEVGLLTGIWGPPTWEALHCISFGYPENPTEEQKHDYMNFFKLLGKTLPCCICRGHFEQHTSKGENMLTIDKMKDRKTVLHYRMLQ